jgi:hypothetical protein
MGDRRAVDEALGVKGVGAGEGVVAEGLFHAVGYNEPSERAPGRLASSRSSSAWRRGGSTAHPGHGRARTCHAPDGAYPPGAAGSDLAAHTGVTIRVRDARRRGAPRRRLIDVHYQRSPNTPASDARSRLTSWRSSTRKPISRRTPFLGRGLNESQLKLVTMADLPSEITNFS